jgi:predicted phage terminase large subunit-like protein
MMESEVLSASLDPASFASWASNGTWKPAAHLDHLNTHLMGLISGDFDRLSVAMPPRHGKSFLCSWFFPAWFLLRFPERRVLLVSYEADFASTWGRRVERKRIPGPSQVRLLQKLDAEWNPHLILIEDVAYQRAFIQHTAQKGLPVKGVRPDGNKLARSIPAADMFETGQLYLPIAAKWLDMAEQELLAFPNGKHDDIVDVISYAAQHIQQRKKRRRKKLTGWKLDPALYKPSMSI